MPRSIDSGLPAARARIARHDRRRCRPTRRRRSRGPSTALRTWWSTRFAPVTHADRRAARRDRRRRRSTPAKCGPDVALRELGMRGEVVVAVEPHRLRRERGRAARTRSPRGRRARSRARARRRRRTRSHFNSVAGSTPRNSATPAMPGRSGVCTFSIGGGSSPARRAPRSRAAARGLDVGRVVAALAPDEVVLADRRDRHELVAHVAAHLARLRPRPRGT